MGSHTVNREKTESSIGEKIKLSAIAAYAIDEQIQLKVPSYANGKVNDFQMPSIIKVGEYEKTTDSKGRTIRTKIGRSSGEEMTH